ncbi:MAG: ubiquinone biosynthesis protein UbiB [Planctomycetes bacterium]|nr:ubiquinone biosynthesis protein UbiB [Planctomycetota bacterium]
MGFETLDRARDLRRLAEITAVFARHGLGELFQRAGITGQLARAGVALRLARDGGSHTKPPEVRLREAFERLGPVFVKLGQLLAGRSDLLPQAWTEELARLQEDVPEVSFEQLAAQLAEDLGAPAERVFRALDRQPLAAGSIAQVHAAELQDGTRVVLKVRRPGIVEVVESDLRLLARIAELLEDRAELRAYRPRAVVRQFTRVLRGELDLAREARNAERLRANLPPNGRLVIPRIVTHLVRERLCVMERFDGPSLGEWVRAGARDGPDPRAVAAAGAEAMLRMVFQDGVFHADPHAGNVILLADGRLGLIDFGQVGSLSEARRHEFLDLLVAIALRRPETAAEVLLAWSEGEAVPEEFEADCAEFIDRYRGRALEQLSAAELVRDINALVREHRLQLPADVTILLKVLFTLEGLGRSLDPSFVAIEHVEPFVRRAERARRSPLTAARRALSDLAHLASDLPRDLRDLRSRMRRGRVGVDIDLPGLERFAERMDQSVNHLTIGMITAALIVGTSVSLTIEGGPRLLGLPLFGAIGFLSSIGVGLWWILVTRRR